MKKISTLFVALLAAASMSAQTEKTEITLGEWSPWDDATTTVKGNTLTMSAAWAGAGNWQANDGKCADWSEGDYLELDVSNCTGSFNVTVEYNDGKSKDEKGNPTVVGKSTGTIGAGDKVCYVKLNGDYSANVIQLWLQSTTANISITVDKAYLIDEDEYTKQIEEAAKERRVRDFDLDKVDQFWGDCTYDISTHTATFPKEWGGAGWWLGNNSLKDFKSVVFVIEPATIKTLVTVTVAGGDPAQVDINAGETIGIADISGFSSNNINQVMLQNEKPGTVTIVKAYASTLSPTDEASYINSQATTISSVTVSKKANEGATYNLAGQRVGKNFRGMVIHNGKKYIQK